MKEGKVTLYRIAKDMAEVNGKSAKENMEILRLFIEVSKDYIKEGKRVFLPHFGTITLRVSSPRRVYIPPKNTFGTSGHKKRLVIKTSTDFFLER